MKDTNSQSQGRRMDSHVWIITHSSVVWGVMTWIQSIHDQHLRQWWWWQVPTTRLLITSVVVLLSSPKSSIIVWKTCLVLPPAFVWQVHTVTRFSTSVKPHVTQETCPRGMDLGYTSWITFHASWDVHSKRHGATQEAWKPRTWSKRYGVHSKRCVKCNPRGMQGVTQYMWHVTQEEYIPTDTCERHEIHSTSQGKNIASTHEKITSIPWHACDFKIYAPPYLWFLYVIFSCVLAIFFILAIFRVKPCLRFITSIPRANRKYSKSKSQVFQVRIASMSKSNQPQVCHSIHLTFSQVGNTVS